MDTWRAVDLAGACEGVSHSLRIFSLALIVRYFLSYFTPNMIIFYKQITATSTCASNALSFGLSGYDEDDGTHIVEVLASEGGQTIVQVVGFLNAKAAQSNFEARSECTSSDAVVTFSEVLLAPGDATTLARPTPKPTLDSSACRGVKEHLIHASAQYGAKNFLLDISEPFRPLHGYSILVQHTLLFFFKDVLLRSSTHLQLLIDSFWLHRHFTGGKFAYRQDCSG